MHPGLAIPSPLPSCLSGANPGALSPGGSALPRAALRLVPRSPGTCRAEKATSSRHALVPTPQPAPRRERVQEPKAAAAVAAAASPPRQSDPRKGATHRGKLPSTERPGVQATRRRSAPVTVGPGLALPSGRSLLPGPTCPHARPGALAPLGRLPETCAAPVLEP